MTTSTVDHLFPADCRSTPSVRVTRQGATYRFDLEQGGASNGALAPMPGLTLKANGTAASAAPQDVPLSTIAAPGNPIGDGIASAATTATVDGLTGAGAVGKQVTKAPDGQTARDAMGVTTKLAVRAQPIEEFAATGTDVTADCAPAISAAAGANLEFGASYGVGDTLLSPRQVLRGRGGNGIVRYDQSAFAKASTMKLAQGRTIRMQEASAIKDMLLISANFIDPVANYTNVNANNAKMLTNATAITLGDGSTTGFAASDALVEKTTILGFNLGVQADGTDSALWAGRFDMRNVKIDCVNGVNLRNIADVARLDNVHIWPFTSYVPGLPPNGDAATVLQRPGYGFRVSGLCDWAQLTNCFVYGHRYGYIVDGVSNCQLIHCQADNAGTTSTANRDTAFAIMGATESCRMIECWTVSHRVAVSLNISGYSYVTRPNLIVTGGQFVANERCFDLVTGNAILDGVIVQAATYGVYIGPNMGNVYVRFRAQGAATNDGARIGTLVYVDPAYAGRLTIHIEDGVADSCNTLLNIPDALMRNGKVKISGAVPWQAWTPPVVVAGALLSSGVTATGRYRITGNTCDFTTTLTFNGTTPPTGQLQVGIPVGIKASTTFAGRRDVVGGQMVQAISNGNTNLATLTLYDNSNPQAANAVITISGSFEIA